MGTQLSTQQREVYLQVVGVLREGGEKFPQSLVKGFVCWMFKFPQIMAKEVRDENFWRTVGCLLTESTKRGDPTTTLRFEVVSFDY